MDNGWIKLYRDLIGKAIWTLSTPEQKVILITLLLMANHEAKDWEWKGRRFICKPGQVITSLEAIAKEAGKGVSIRNVRTALERFQNFRFLTNESTKQSRLITICNWESYQKIEEQADKQTDKRLTNDRQTGDKRVTTNKNDKNDKNNIKEKEKEKSEVQQTKVTTPRFKPPTIQEVEAYIRERDYSIDADRFVDYYTSNGWMVGKNRMKDWQAAVRSWARKSQSTTTPSHYVAPTTHRQPPADFHEQRRSEIARQVAQDLAATAAR